MWSSIIEILHPPLKKTGACLEEMDSPLTPASNISFKKVVLIYIIISIKYINLWGRRNNLLFLPLHIHILAASGFEQQISIWLLWIRVYYFKATWRISKFQTSLSGCLLENVSEKCWDQQNRTSPCLSGRKYRMHFFLHADLSFCFQKVVLWMVEHFLNSQSWLCW